MSTESIPMPITAPRIRRAVARNGWAITACVVLPVAAAVMFLLIVPPRFRAITEILLDPRGLVVVQNDVTPRSDSNDSAVSLVESQIRVLLSEAVMRSVVERLRLYDDPEFVGPPTWLSWIRARLTPSGPPEDPRITALRSLQRIVDAQRASRSYVIVVRVKSLDPVKAAHIANVLAQTYIDHESKARSATAQRVGSAMESRLHELGERLMHSEEAVERFKETNDLVKPGEQLITDQQLEEMNTKLVEARVHTAAQRARLERIEELIRSGASPEIIAEVVQSSTIAGMRVQYAEILREQGSSDVLLGPRHPRAKAIREQRQRQHNLIQEELRRIVAAARDQYHRAKAIEDGLSAKLDNLKRAAAVSNEAMVRLRELKRKAESNQTIYAAFLVRAKELAEQGGVDTLSIRVISAAIAPNRPSIPRGRLLLLALVAGLLAATGLVWFKVQNDESVVSRW